jgi:hypothetical protein
MSPRYAAKTVGAGFAVAALAALAQLGLAYGFGLLSWADAAPGAAEPVLDYRSNANLAWVAWFSAASGVVGGLASGAIGSRAAARLGPAIRVTAVLASAVGAFAVGPLVSLSAERGAAFTSFPTEPLIAAGLGAAVGFALALIGLSSRSVAVNVGASVALVWLLAVLAVFVEVGEPVSPVAELAVWGSWVGPDTFLGMRGFAISVPFVTGSALIGVVVAILARRGPISSSGYRIAAASGIAGPLIVTVAHFYAGPSPVDSADSMSVILVGPYAAIAGLLGSLIVCALPKSGGQLDDAPQAGAPQVTEPREAPTGLVETVPGWTVPEPASAYDDTRKGDTKDLPGKGPDPELDWVQELKPVEPGATLTAEPETATVQTETEDKPKRRPRKTARTRRKLDADEPNPDKPA